MKHEPTAHAKLAEDLDFLRKRIVELEAQTTHRQHIIERLQESQSLFRTIYAESPISIELCDAKGRVVDANRACLDMFGMSQVADRKWPGIFDDPLVPQPAKESLRQHEVVRYETSVNFDQLKKDQLYGGTRSGTAYLDVLASPLGVRVGQSLSGYLLEIQDITDLKQAEQRLQSHQEQLRSLASQLSLAEERERRRLAADLHDQVGQSLAAIKLKLGAARQAVLASDAGHHLDEIRGLVEEAIRQTRSLTFDLSPPILYELGLEPALEWLAEQFQAKHAISASLEDDGQTKPLEDDVRGLLFRAVSELLMNIAKHAQARTVVISVSRRQNDVHIQVRDDGMGFNETDTDRRTSGFGLFNIRERLTAIGGRLAIDSEPGRGASITLVAPLSVRGRDPEDSDS